MSSRQLERSVGTRLARLVISASKCGPLRGRGGYSEVTLAGRGRTGEFAQADTESDRVDDFFAFFGDLDVRSALADKAVLDFGSGYGGRTVEYARLGARFVWGVEPFESMVDRSNAYAHSRGVENVSFVLCTQDDIPLDDATFDVVLSYDVLEHVNDPRRSIAEIHRVLRPGGVAYLVFPVYWGALSHHLDYVTMVPGLHWFFSPQALVRAVNSVLATAHQSDVRAQPEPRLSFDKSRFVLPSLNGLGGEHLPGIFHEFAILRMHRHGLLRRRRARSLSMRVVSAIAPTRLQDMLTSSVSCVVQKRDVERLRR